MNTDIIKPSECKSQRTGEREGKLHKEVMHNQLFRNMEEIADRENSW